MLKWINGLRLMGEHTEDEAKPSFQNPFPNIGEDEPEEAAAAAGGDETVDVLKDRFAELEAKYNETARLNEQLLDRVDRLVAGVPAHSGGDVERRSDAPALPELKDLPDPAKDPQAYAAAMRDFVVGTMKAANDQSSRQQDAKGKVNQVFESFKSEYPDLAKHEPIVESMARKEIERLKASGDPVQAMLRDPAGFNARVARSTEDYLEKNFPAAKGGEGEPGKEATRTGGVKGGSTAKGSATKDKAKPSSFLAEIKESQTAMGLY